jgi:hypothetical protein
LSAPGKNVVKGISIKNMGASTKNNFVIKAEKIGGKYFLKIELSPS